MEGKGVGRGGEKMEGMGRRCKGTNVGDIKGEKGMERKGREEHEGEGVVNELEERVTKGNEDKRREEEGGMKGWKGCTS